jgi:hypothetical protein
MQIPSRLHDPAQPIDGCSLDWIGRKEVVGLEDHVAGLNVFSAVLGPEFLLGLFDDFWPILDDPFEVRE